MSPRFDPQLLWDWVAARSVARGQPMPVPDSGGLRVDTGLPEEARRYVFLGPDPGIRTLAASIRTPLTFIKMCAPAEELLALAPPSWRLESRAHFMIQAEARDVLAPLPPGYRIELARAGDSFSASVLADDGALAASGHAAQYGSVFIYDRIITHPAHRRRGLGRALMSALGSMQQSPAQRRVLVATDEGRTLYESLGWTLLSAYATIFLPGQPCI